MALNCSTRPVFPGHTSEGNLVSPMRVKNGYVVEGVLEKNTEGYCTSQEEAKEWDFSCNMDRVIHCSSSAESTSKDIADLLPSDPFGMDIKSTLTAITGWLEDLEVDRGGYSSTNNYSFSQENYDLFERWNLIWSYALKFQPYFSNYEVPYMDTHSFSSSVQFEALDYDNKGGIVQFEEKEGGVCKSKEVLHEGFVLALSYLGLKDLLLVERVSKSLCYTVRGDPFMWSHIHIDQPLNEKITDDALVRLASKARGNLQCLSLVVCPKVTDDGVRHVLETNPQLTKLSVPGCTRLTIEGMLDNIKIYNSNKNSRGIKHLRIGGLYPVTHEHYEELKSLLSGAIDFHKVESRQNPPFYHRGNFYLPYDDDRAIDIEICPKCEKYKLVYDCPSEICRVKDDESSQVCRGCTLCVPRCAQCGTCVNDVEYEEMFNFEFLCSDCVKQLPKYQK